MAPSSKFSAGIMLSPLPFLQRLLILNLFLRFPDHKSFAEKSFFLIHCAPEQPIKELSESLWVGNIRQENVGKENTVDCLVWIFLSRIFLSVQNN